MRACVCVCVCVIWHDTVLYDIRCDTVWQVKRRVKHSHKEKSEEKEKPGIHKNEEREELDFQFDEELDTPPPTGRHNAFSEW